MEVERRRLLRIREYNIEMRQMTPSQKPRPDAWAHGRIESQEFFPETGDQAALLEALHEGVALGLIA